MTSSAALAIVPDALRMIVDSDLLGSLSIEPGALITFPAGLLGLPECRTFALVAAAREGMFWLQSAEHSALTFLLVDPFVFFPGYAVDLQPADLAELGGGRHAAASQIAVLAIVTLPGSRDELPTANLQGPLAIDLATRRGKQVVISDREFGVSCPVDLRG
jgi:flagellar assembly factor FliW